MTPPVLAAVERENEALRVRVRVLEAREEVFRDEITRLRHALLAGIMAADRAVGRSTEEAMAAKGLTP